MVSACVGAPWCAQGPASTQTLAAELVAAGASSAGPTSAGANGAAAPRPMIMSTLVAPSWRGLRLGVPARCLSRRPGATTTSATPTEIYRQSFATIRAEADLAALPADAQVVAVRMIHATGEIGLVADLAFHPRLVGTARDALRAGAPIFTDAQMIASGITRRRLPAENEIRCLLHDDAYAGAGLPLGHHPLGRRGLAVGRRAGRCGRGDRQRADGAVPPARGDRRRRSAARGDPGHAGRLRRLGGVQDGALAENPWDLPYLVVHGRRGGSALCVAAMNALAQEAEI